MTVTKHNFVNKRLTMGLIMILFGLLPPAFGQRGDEELPVVTAASMPLYPRTALLVHIQGIVKIRVKTDGAKVASLDNESGPAMLVQAAEDNIRTWKFEEHKPTTFVVTFQYEFEDPGQCGPGNATVVLHLPSDVRVSTPGVHTCDPASTIHKDK